MVRSRWLTLSVIFLYLGHVTCQSDSVFTKSAKECQESLDFSSGTCHVPKDNDKRYIVYNVNYGEGFNLRRDIYIRIAPLINGLNKRFPHAQWTLVLPPWGAIPHWRREFSKKLTPWSTFFDIRVIQEFVHAIEWHTFLDEIGAKPEFDAIFQLQHLPFEEHGPSKWEDSLEVGVECEKALQFILRKDNGVYTGLLWGSQITGRDVQCMGLNGGASKLEEFISKSDYKIILLERAEVILWESYGDANYWAARSSLKFSKRLTGIARQFLESHMSNGSESYIGVHLRRRDFLEGSRSSQVPSIPGAASQIAIQMKKLAIYTVFIASDGERDEITLLKSEIIKSFRNDPSPSPKFLQFHKNGYSDGECAIIDQILCSWASHFIGTRDSTFSLRIHEEREILGLPPSSTFNSFCPDDHNLSCPQPTQWRIKFTQDPHIT